MVALASDPLMASTNLDRYRKDLEALITAGDRLGLAMELECFPAQVEAIKKEYGDEAQKILDGLPTFGTDYQGWYSESKSLITQLLPDRLDDFVRLYEKPKARKALTSDTYRIEDYLQGLSVTQTAGLMTKKVVDRDAAIPQFQQQLAILRSVQKRFDSSLFDIRQLVQADLFDSELDAAEELRKNGYLRAAGAVAGVVLEHHLAQVCDNHRITIKKKNPTIADFNDALKEAGAIQIADWRYIQHLGDLRNLCDHRKAADPSEPQVTDLIAGVSKIAKSLF
jgi:hypothetical protein